MIIDATLGSQTKQTLINFSGSGDNAIIAGVFGKIIKVQQLFLVLGAASNLVFKSGSTALTGTMTMLANGAMMLDYIQLPITCNSGDAFVINSSNAVVVGGMIWFIQS